MDKNAKIRDTVSDYVTREEMFTSVDISNDIKRKLLSMEIRNVDVTAWLKTNQGDALFANYALTTVSVNNGSTFATLYYPHWKDPEDYTNRNQTALSPTDIDELKKQMNSAIPPAPANFITTTVKVTGIQTPAAPARKDDSHIDILDALSDGPDDGTGVQMKKKLNAKDRIEIPGEITRAMGWKPGDIVDTSKIKIHTGQLSSRLVVHHDGRARVPRKCVGYGTDPIKVILKNNEVYFEKA